MAIHPLAQKSKISEKIARAAHPAEARAVMVEIDMLLKMAKAIGDSTEIVNELQVKRLEAVRKAGSLLASIERESGKRTDITSLPKVTRLQESLHEVGITSKTCLFWQRVAAIPEDVFYAYTDEQIGIGGEVSMTGLLIHAKRYFTQQERIGLVKQAHELPTGIYNVIYADPPWEYNNNIESWGTAAMHYPTLPLASICAYLDTIKLQVADNAVLFLWVTAPYAKDAFQVIEAWNFEYKTQRVWIKTELKKPGSGFYVRGRHELLYICTRGSFTPLDKHITPPIGSVIEAPIGIHSQKPNGVYEDIERLYPECNYIELFARARRKGWEAIGNELV